MTVWVCKDDGTIQCQDNPEISLDEMRATLAGLIGDNNIIQQEKRSRIVIRLCGTPTGQMNAYEITELGKSLLFGGIRGPEGFRLCPGQSSEEPTEGKPVDQASEVIRSARLTSTGATPVLIRELLGRTVRVYTTGDAITQDFRPERVNIEMSTNREIVDIWFG